ncbi:type II toxin-antitoxin system CcdA family antitoxin [Pseudocolwellia sp. HL-MZ19]|uniref:type II toxin-antitoxin system CcdA family antitoxin n=1 Tax=unclassified Pseudocolwellia TaxID=2848178 RepID=UPI003CE7DDFB
MIVFHSILQTLYNLDSDNSSQSEASKQTIEAKEWVTENKKAIKSYNDFIAEHGCFSAEYREYDDN